MTASAQRVTIGALTLSVGEVLGKLATLAVFSLIAHRLGAAPFGVFNVGLGVGLLLASAVTLGFDQRFVQLVGSEPDSLNARLSSLIALRMALALGVIAASTLVLFFIESNGTRRATVLVLIVAGCADALVEAFRTAANIRGLQSVAAGVLVAQRLLALAIVAVVLYANGGVLPVSVAYAAASVVSLVLMVGVLRATADVRPQRSLLSGAHMRDFLRAVPVTGLNDLVAMTLSRIDVVLLAVIAGDLAVGHYTAAYRLLETVLFISWSICRVIQPVLADRTTTLDERSRLLTGSLVMICVIYLPYAAVLLARGPEIVHLLFGNEFNADNVLYALAFAPVFFGLAQVGANALLARRPDPAVLRASAAALVLNVVLNIVFIPFYGATAAAVVTTLAYITQAVICLNAVRRVTPFGAMGRSLTVAILASLATAAVLLAPIPLIPALVAAAAVYVAGWLLLTSRWDRDMFTVVRGVVRPS